MASSDPNGGRGHSPRAVQGEEQFKLGKRNLRDGYKLFVQYGTTTTGIPEDIRQRSTLHIQDDLLIADDGEVVYEMNHENGSITFSKITDLDGEETSDTLDSTDSHNKQNEAQFQGRNMPHDGQQFKAGEIEKEKEVLGFVVVEGKGKQEHTDLEKPRKNQKEKSGSNANNLQKDSPTNTNQTEENDDSKNSTRQLPPTYRDTDETEKTNFRRSLKLPLTADERIGCDRNTSPKSIHEDVHISQSDTNTNLVARTKDHPKKVPGHINDNESDSTTARQQSYSSQEKLESKNQDEEEEPYIGSCTRANTGSEVANTDVDNSSDVLPSLDIIQTSDHVEDTASEIDTDSSDDEGTGLEICLIVDFQTKVNGKLQNFARPFYITLAQDNFLKWQFICANQHMVEQRLDNIRGDFEKVTYDDGILKVSLGKQRRNPDLDELANKIQTVFLENTESLIINWFPTDMQINNSVAASELNKVLEQSEILKNRDIYMCTTDSGQIRLVFDAKQKKTVDELIQTAIQECCDKIMPKSTNRKISLPVIYGQLLHQMNIVERIESKFPDVSMVYDISYSSNQCSLELVGPDSAVGEADRWMKDNFVNVYTSEKIKCAGVDNWLRQLDVSTLIREQLQSKCPSDVFWMIHKPTQTVWLCSSDRRNLQNTVTEVRTCLKQSHIVMERDKLSMDAIEKMLVWIGGMEDILNRKAAVNVFADNSGVNICITGGCSYVESMAGRIRQFINEETSALA